MLKITLQTGAGFVAFELEGRLVGPWVGELERCWRSALDAPQHGPMRVDLSAVTFIDADGKALLARMYHEGAELAASGCLNKCIVEEIMQTTEKKV